MKLLITGSSRADSWEIRGKQLGNAICAKVIRDASEKEIKAADIVIVVKKPSPDLLSRLHLAKVLVWDTVDPWPQKGATLSKDAYIKHVQDLRAMIKPDYVICATELMREDIDGDFVLYHHHRIDIPKATIKPDIRTMVYDGNVKFLGIWADILDRQCRKRGWEFVCSDEIWKHDICVAFRGRPYDTYATRCWKSNVKLANAQGAGVPFVGLPEMGYLETDSGGIMIADNEMILSECLDCMTYEYRKMANNSLLASAYSVDDCAKDYLRILRGL